MNKKILIIGGTYFTGRVFAFLAVDEGYDISILNRGRFSMKALDGDIKEYVCDRRDETKLRSLAVEEHYDAIVDFCAYEPGDITMILDCLRCKTDQYIYISTADVAKPSAQVRDEQSDLQEQEPKDEVGLYTWKKLLLERELQREAGKRGIAYTILRPAFIYGPYNYAPRESWYIRNIVAGNALPQPTDATGKFNMVYVKDVARAIHASILYKQSNNKIFLLSAPEVLTYDLFLQDLKAVSDCEVRTYPVTVQQVIKNNIPLPFPLTEAENELFDGQKIVRELGFAYENRRDAMQKTYQAFADIYRKK